MASVIRGDDNFDSSVGGSTTAGAVGTYIWASPVSSSTADPQFVLGTTYAGTGLYPAGFASNNASTTTAGTTKYVAGNAIGIGDTSSAALSGTWRAMGTTPPVSSAYDEMPTCLFVRIS
jgi:hypothetical protein